MTDREMMNWLEKHPNVENGCADDDGDTVRVIYRVTGSPNDQEWKELGRGATLRDAIKIAASK